MRGAYYINSIENFLIDSKNTIRDFLTEGTSKGFYQQLSTLSTSWVSLIEILKESFKDFPEANNWGLLLEYPIPRRAKRIDAVIITRKLIIVIEFKDGVSDYLKDYIVQLEDYCLDLRDFHFESKDRIIIPILLCTNGEEVSNNFIPSGDYVQNAIYCNKHNFRNAILKVISVWNKETANIHFTQWNNSKYFPTPTIIEAAQSLYAGQNVKEISRSHAGAENLTITTNAVLDAIKEAQSSNSKIICFITGVPGSGKTLAGLNIVHNREFNTNEKELGVFLSGNSPLVKVLSEALSRDCSKREKINKKEANRKVSTFIHNVHQFIDDYYEEKTSLPVDRVLIYDEAQRAWTKEYKYFKSKKRINASEPEILLEIMDRFENTWSVIIALVGGGQEINTGEGGLSEWGKAIMDKYSHWKVYISPELKVGNNFTDNMFFLKKINSNLQIIENPDLHLKVAIRSYKAQELSEWVNFVLLDKNKEAKEIFQNKLKHYPIFITRSLSIAKEYLKQKARGSRRRGLVASSGAKRLRAIGIDIAAGLKGTSDQNELGAWYLNPSDDVRSSNFLEVIGSEFGVQGLELDWTCICWDADLRRSQKGWDFKNFSGTKWRKVNDPADQQFLLNTYRVLLTRAREGIIIFVPTGDEKDTTRLPEFYNPIYEYLKSCGIEDIK